MFHALALVEIKDGRPEHFFKSFFQVTFVDGDFAAEFLDGQGFADMLEEYFPGLGDLIPIGPVGEEFALESFYFLLPYHTFQAIQQEHLALGIDEDIFQAVRIGMV